LSKKIEEYHRIKTKMKQIYLLIKKIGFKAAFCKIKRRVFVKDKDVISGIARLGAYDYLQKYKYVLDSNSQETKELPINPYPDKVWVCWLQGVENAPRLVQKCIESIKQYEGEKVILLNSENIKEYIILPDYIEEKYKKGIIPHAHYADVIRVALLAKYGGVWIDATYLMFDKVPDYVKESDFFCFKCTPYAASLGSNNFLAARPNTFIIQNMENLLFEYWRKEKKLVSYSIFHVFLYMMVNNSIEARKKWGDIPYFDCNNNFILQMELFNPFDNKRLEQIRQMSAIQKLSYKFSEEQFNMKGTFYDVLINNKG
jgi:hypothetical protein